ncbi:Imm50 family immunity protein [Asticcacaulis benevestitus]|nr:Imm50 family immunity protein [Asticcacaulis benevestitus]
MEENQLDWGPVIRWFGHVPLFHDAEVVSIELRRDPIPSIVRLFAFRMNSDIDERGYYRLDLHALVTFSLSGIGRVELDDWNHQNALQSLEIKKVDDAYQLDMVGAYGVHGLIAAKSIAVQVEPWLPDLAVK